MKRGLFILLIGAAFVGLAADAAEADRYTSPSYTIDASVVGNSFGGDSTGGSYQLTVSGGESVIGQGSGGSYRLDSGYVAQLQNSLQLTVQPSGLVAYYNFDEGSGSFVRDVSSNALDGSTTNSPAWTTGQVGEALVLNGTSQDVRVPDAADLDLTGDFAVSAWIRPGATTQTANARVVSKFDNTLLNYMLAYDSAGTRMRFLVDCDSRTTITSTSTLTNTSNWYHVLGVKSGTSLKLYINGSEEASGTCTGTVQTNAASLGIGSTQGTTYYNGRVDEVKLFSRALSENEISAQYAAGQAGNPSGLSFSGEIIPGLSEQSNYDAVVLTDALTGYTLSVSQNQNLTKGGDSISGVSGTIASPANWSEGTTKGLGFTLTGTNATAIDAKWNSGNAYAAFPGSATSFYTRTGGQSTKDVLNLRLRLDVATSQPSGLYTNVITTTGTITP